MDTFFSLPLATLFQYCRVVPEVSLDQAFDYQVPEALQSCVALGSKVQVPLGNREVTGYVVQQLRAQEVMKGVRLKPISRVYGEGAFIPGRLIKLAHWMAQYYCAPLGLVLKSLLPEAVRRVDAGYKERLWVKRIEGKAEGGLPELKRSPGQRAAWLYLQKEKEGWLAEFIRETRLSATVWHGLEKKGLLEIGPARQERDPFAGEAPLKAFLPLQLNEEQQAVLEVFLEEESALREGKKVSPRPLLLHGVTGSGKTELYLQAMEVVLKQGRCAILLVPEISLTPQIVDQFRARFTELPSGIAVLHSHLSQGERHDQWHRIRQGEARLVIGARSAIFAPVENLGLIVVDEEHETSYKQEESPHYHARDLAVMRAHLEKVPVLLGSATPSLESYLNAKEGKYQLCRLTKRVDGQQLPTTHILDLRRELKKDQRARALEKKEEGSSAKSQGSLLAGRLIEAVQCRLDQGEQVILFLNRRGYASSLQCSACGYVEESPTCSVPLTYHRTSGQLICHLSGFAKAVPFSCPECGFTPFRHLGMGTQKIEHVLQEIFPQASIARMDSDSMQGKNAHREILRAFSKKEIDILVGTQMIAKGLHFPNVTCVGVVNADAALQLPDFRASERVFQMLCQVGGRSGRGQRPGEVFVQSRTPFHSSIQFARHHDYEGFAEQELEFRQALGYPPYSRSLLITWRGSDPGKTLVVAQQEAKEVEALFLEFSQKTKQEFSSTEHSASQASKEIHIGQVAPAPIEKIHNQYRFHLFLRIPRSQMLAVMNKLRPLILEKQKGSRGGIKRTIDVDPFHLL